MKELRGRFDGSVDIAMDDEWFTIRAILVKHMETEDIPTIGGPIHFESTWSWTGSISGPPESVLRRMALHGFEMKFADGVIGTAILTDVHTGTIKGFGLPPF